ncbi:RsfS/YbeB/iojap family protein [Aspergillus saccharolyticus JOP 1030-1]|uniref:ATPase synthesis protein 25 n=1 Tax=Aspergillus saccharolyticus JOP 1030-1 TaxID=1450539 RepID=A0A318ZZM7_9EURO|nr:hypothetical protein BP01DRAFT_193219 [Aspergillus saccharolyticus JOP 1030-1]PYH40822.1 hypothetical protein BP01DRAFT_193219 [Aspergillus saccharolyticus JOP 1030-1]
MMNRALLRRSWLRPGLLGAPHAPLSATTAAAAAVVPRFTPTHTTTRPFISYPSHQSEQPPSTTPTPPPEIAFPKDPELATTDPETTTTTPETQEHIPWYLRDAPDQHPSAPRELLREQIPSLPPNPPALLSALLEYTFKDLGLDELKLLDLRGLDTPPALGANVIMLVGTARSVKHLNVSADRLCRWLRSTYKLSPFADGLLGRNELKIKLRRKAKRARLASKSGTIVDEKDDGITTGWICVNAGIVEEAPLSELKAVEEAGFEVEGFGHDAGLGTRVVVQMFTEEKRAEVDLEGLWEKNLARVERLRVREEKERERGVDTGEEWL